ncbi:TlpA disulfide reductase family protein [Flavobacterium sp. LC2016-01]|uniref:TlpA family protein disulfide reductase n=1 Tax=Flavobacterium sp. LC2016-01 TaxID=2675876 RepID=UPI0012BA63BD|nr:TlpA disulfide reductase family protein [Flavobacterium sp. LC2016-01]MTH16360.1 redoxin domain-containing protein [Flavobacterium sp. LC2016-01]
MKKIFFLLLIAVLYSFTTSEETIIVSGKITNTENGIIKIKGDLLDKEIKLKPDGSFSENLKLESDGIYKIETTKNSFPIYLAKDSKLVLSADDANLASTLKFTGKGSVENQYLAKKQLITSAVAGEEFYKLDENEFLKKLQEIKKSVNTLYLKTKFTDAEFKAKESRSIHYLEQKHLLYYIKQHYYLVKQYDFKVSEKYPKFDETMDLDNNSDFLFSKEYQEIVLVKFYENIKGDDNSLFISAKNTIPEIKALKSQSMKNSLIENSKYDISMENPEYEKTYQEFLSITNDPNIKQTLTANYNATNALQPGKPSPKFDYENQKGGKTSLDNLKGKYIYIDLWATWCSPCREQIPFLQKVEEQYKGKNIEFVSISIDALKDQPKWSKFVTDKQLGGIQLLAENEWESKIIKDYSVQGVPTFILLDPNGNIVTARAPKPSDPKLIDLLNNLKI